MFVFYLFKFFKGKFLLMFLGFVGFVFQNWVSQLRLLRLASSLNEITVIACRLSVDDFEPGGEKKQTKPKANKISKRTTEK